MRVPILCLMYLSKFSVNRNYTGCNTNKGVFGLTQHSVLWKLEGCLTVHLPHEIKCNSNLMQIGNFIGVFLARRVSGAYAHHQEH